jgi:hypothetical protein
MLMHVWDAPTIEMSNRLVQCADALSKLRSALVTMEAWADDSELSGEAALRDRLALIKRYAGEVKDIGLEI